MKKYSEYAPMRLHLRMEMCCHWTHSLCFSRCGLRNCCLRQHERSLNDRVTQMLYWSRALLLCTHTRVLLCPPLLSAVSLTSLVLLLALWLHGPARAAAAVVFAKHQSRSVNIQRLKHALCVHCLATSRFSLEMVEAPQLLSRINAAEEFKQFEWVSVRSLLGVLRGKSRVFCHQLSNQPWVSAHSHPRVPTLHREQDIAAAEKPSNLSSASPAGVVLTRSDFNLKFISCLF